jgi:hypothetical protein
MIRIPAGKVKVPVISIKQIVMLFNIRKRTETVFVNVLSSVQHLASFIIILGYISTKACFILFLYDQLVFVTN